MARIACCCASRTVRVWKCVAAVFFLVLASACFPPGAFQPVAPADPQLASDMAMVEQVASAQAAAVSAPGDAALAARFGQTLAAAYEVGTVSRGRLDPSLLSDAVARLDAATAAQPEASWLALSAKGMLLRRAGQEEAGLVALEASMSATPNTVALAELVPAYAATRRHADLDGLCEATLATAGSNDERYAVLTVCAGARPGMTGAALFPWASAEDVSLYEEQRALDAARAEAEQRAWEAQQQREREALQASFAQPSDRGATPAQVSTSSPQRASVTLKNNCRDRVRVFFGDKPKYGSGTYAWVSSNSVSSYAMDAGDMLWVVDEHDNGLSSTSAPAGSSRIEITEACTGFVIR